MSFMFLLGDIPILILTKENSAILGATRIQTIIIWAPEER